jgi:hypothetical protein
VIAVPVEEVEELVEGGEMSEKRNFVYEEK